MQANNAGCNSIDSIYITQRPKPSLLPLHQLTICSATQQFETLSLNPFYTYQWQTLLDTLNNITFTKPGCENVSIQSEYGYSVTDNICITDICEATVFEPNAFTPNGINNTFKPITNYVQSMH
jgi:hypothetical protein